MCRAMYRGAAAIAAAALTFGASAAHSAAAQEDALKLVRLMKLDAQIDEAKRQCNDMVKTVTPESVYQNNPAQFGGITPESRLWPSVVNAFQQFYFDSCAYIDKQTLLDVAAASYAASLSPKDLTSAIEFYSSPLGQRLADAQASGAAAFQREAAKRMAVSYKRANEEFATRITELVKGSRKQ